MAENFTVGFSHQRQAQGPGPAQCRDDELLGMCCMGGIQEGTFSDFTDLLCIIRIFVTDVWFQLAAPESVAIIGAPLWSQ